MIKITTSSQRGASFCIQNFLKKKGPSTLGMTTLPWLQPQKGQPQLFLTFSYLRIARLALFRWQTSREGLFEDLPESIYVTRVDLDFPPVLQGFGATKDALAPRVCQYVLFLVCFRLSFTTTPGKKIVDATTCSTFSSDIKHENTEVRGFRKHTHTQAWKPYCDRIYSSSLLWFDSVPMLPLATASESTVTPYHVPASALLPSCFCVFLLLFRRRGSIYIILLLFLYI